ncbi:MAG: galactokinase [Anaerolineae bacterium]
MPLDAFLLQQAFRERFGADPEWVVRAPGRVNLIGEHTDYNEGFVLPMAIDRAIWIALRARTDRTVRLYSLDFGQEVSFSLDSLQKGEGWVEYLKGVAHVLERQGRAFQLRGWEGVLSGDVPRGAGLSSSAALELAAARAFAAVSQIAWRPEEMARLAQQAENEWVGVQCGIMDQMAVAASQAGHALFLDCRTLEYQHISLPAGVVVVVLDTSTRRGLVASAYNERRYQCEQAARFLGVKALRDVTLEWLEKRLVDLNATVVKRARHVVSENQRVLEAIAAMQSGDVQRLGELFNESHASLRDDFEVTNDALNLMVSCAQGHPACWGARMTGAGFGGCAVALVRQDSTEAFAQAVRAAYRQKSGLEASVYVCQASQGASIVFPAAAQA